MYEFYNGPAARLRADLGRMNLQLVVHGTPEGRWVWRIGRPDGSVLASGVAPSRDLAWGEIERRLVALLIDALPRPALLQCPHCEHETAGLGLDRVTHCPQCGHRADLTAAACDCTTCWRDR